MGDQWPPGRTRAFPRALLLLSPLLIAGTAWQAEAQDRQTTLEDYVVAPDAAYGFAPSGTLLDGDGFTIHLVQMTSQRWRTASEAWRTESNGERSALWRHWLTVIVPDKVTTDIGLVVVAGGSNDGSPPTGDKDAVVFGAQLAVLSGSVVTVLEQVPNQPLSFADEPFPHREDEIVAYSWDQAMTTGDYTWPVYLPMVKSVVRTLDTVQAFVPSVAPAVTINEFVITGFSKRGAAAWLTAAVDPRIKAIAPGVIDILNFAPQIEHHLAVYGDYSPAIHDYVDYDIVSRGRTPEGQALIQVVDPFNYRDRLVMPKLIINAAGDQFFPPDSTRFYFSQLAGETLLRYVPNTDHSLSTSDDTLVSAVNALFSWYLNVLYDIPRPAMAWRNDANRLTVSTSESALTGVLWQASNANARDFRGGTIGETWSATVIGGPGDSEYVAQVEPPPRGWKAYFVELIYPPKHHGFCQSYSTQVYVIPDLRPFDELDPVLDPEDIAYPVNPPLHSAVDAGTPGTFPNDLPLAEVNGTVAAIADSGILNYLPDDVAAQIAEECPGLALVNVAVRELKRRGDEVVTGAGERIDGLRADGDEVADHLADEASDLGETAVKACEDRSGFLGDLCETADWF